MTVVNDTQAAEYYNKQPRKRVGAGVLIFNEQGELLIVKPNYLEKWLWIGGSADENEAPSATALRECKEEIGIVPSPLRLGFVNYLPAQSSGQSDILQFLFTCDPVADSFLKALKLQEDEIEDARFVPIQELDEYLHSYRSQAVQTYCKHQLDSMVVYMENGQLVA